MKRDPRYDTYELSPEELQDAHPEPREAFVFYDSFFRAIRLLPPNRQNLVLRHLIECALHYRPVHSPPYPSNAIVSQMLTNIDYADRRHTIAIRNGESGGRPKLEVDLKLAQELYTQSHSWKTVAEQMGISDASLYRARKAGGLV